MAFKMKGSAFKLNNVATKSALKQKNELHENIKKRLNTGEDLTEAERVEMLNKLKADYKKESSKKSDTVKVNMKDQMNKTPLEQGTKFTDKLKAFGTAVTSRYGLMTPGNASLKKAYSKYKSEKKKYRAADRKSEMNKKD
jgi:hypothetical protein